MKNMGTKAAKPAVILAMLACLTLATGCSAGGTVAPADSFGSVAVDWDRVNAAIDSYDFSAHGYYIGDYEEEETEFNQVIVTNYDSSISGAFREVEYQLTISYGETFTWDAGGETVKTDQAPMIELALLSNRGDGDYSVIYAEDGTPAEESGAWFLPDDQTEYMQRLLLDAQEMFGLDQEYSG